MEVKGNLCDINGSRGNFQIRERSFSCMKLIMEIRREESTVPCRKRYCSLYRQRLCPRFVNEDYGNTMLVYFIIALITGTSSVTTGIFFFYLVFEGTHDNIVTVILIFSCNFFFISLMLIRFDISPRILPTNSNEAINEEPV